MHFYGIAYRDVLALPVKTFWLLHKNVDRISAERDMRMIMVMGSVQSSEALNGMTASLRKQMGVVVEIDEAAAAVEDAVFDRSGLDSLRGLGKLI